NITHYTIFEFRKTPLNGVWKKIYPFFFKNQSETTTETDQVTHVIEEVVNHSWLLELEVDNNNANELLDSKSKEMTVHGLIEMCEEIATKKTRRLRPTSTRKANGNCKLDRRTWLI
ncbi:hypothetical protein AVEN_140000-1, partial [Araneus ventricosus]